ncbi:MAG: VCBS repeat-containing protein [Planctomycetota bacterium]
MRFSAFSILVLAAPASAQFGTYQDSELGLGSARDIEVVDFDGDGLLDLVVPDVVTRRIVLYRGVGGGAFDAARALGGGPVTTLSPGPTVVAAGDLDGDGDPDVVALSENGEAVLLANLGDGTTASPMPLATVADARSSFGLSIELQDIDDDGWLDVVSSTDGPSSFNAGGTFVQLNLGGLAFAPRVRLTQSLTPGGTVTFGDVDGDGDDDTIVNHAEDRELYVIRNDGVLPRTSVTSLPWNGALGTFLDLELGDFDLDGDLDLLAAGPAINRAHIYENDGTGQFAAPTVAIPGGGSIGDLVPVDVDSDGDLDVVWALTPGDRRLQWVENLGGGVFSGVRGISAGVGFWRIQVVDLDQDGVVDIAAQNPDLTYWLRGDASAPFSPFEARTPVSPTTETGAIVLIDADGDADLDVVGARRSLGQFSFIENAGEGELLAPSAQAVGPAGGASALRAADLDGDGDPDLAPIPNDDEPLLWYESLGGFTLGSSAEVPFAGDRAVDLQFGDVDGDGDQDAVVLARFGTEGRISWAQNPGDGSFAAPTAIADLPLGAGTLELADIDLDGTLDVVATEEGPTTAVSLIRGLGGGAFGPRSLLAAPGASRVLPEFALVDVDGDTLVDLVLLRESTPSDFAEWIRNLGGGAFSPAATRIASIVDPDGELQGADLDEDGDTDLLLGSVASLNGTVWLENPQGPSAWPTQTLLVFGSRVLAAAAGDLDCDGDVEVLVAPEERGVGLFENLALGSIGGTAPCGPATPNSTGVPGRLELVGDVDVVRNRVTLQAHALPSNVFGYFLTSQMNGATFPVPGSVGRLCLMGEIGRFNGPGEVLSAGPAGSFCLPIDLTAIPQPTGSVQAVAGSTWFFQAWHRDVAGGSVVSNFTTAAGVTFQ